ncbi:tyrosine-type recombinase/integrase [Actinomadura logoneensis]|uniref:tyrosine-type recombinase/integrase n=1 Tax=Actinomadura logoneensis TaxID=2293572 RepID=UPI001F260BEA|nr:tyrosine-type recombinase/integrase [Actinomadura logoneensis]
MGDLQRVGGALRFVTPKSEDSERTKPLPLFCGSVWRSLGPASWTSAEAWPDRQNTGSSSPRVSGRQWSRTTFGGVGAGFARRRGLDGVRFHDMRHTCVSLLLHLGVAPDVVREIAGHSDIDVTMAIYAHTSLEEKRAALGKLGDALS